MPVFSERGAYNIIPGPEELAKYDFNDKSSLSGTVWRVNVAFMVLVGVVVSLRVFARASMTQQFFADDILAIFAALFTLVSSATSIVATKYGLGDHVWNLAPPIEHIMDSIKHCVQLMYVAHIFYAAASTFTKLSIITSYLRIFPHELLRRILYGTGVLVTGIGISAIFATMFQCSPVQAAWDFTIEDSQCFEFVHFLYANAAANILIDFVLVVAPLPYFWSLSLPLRQRLVICILFGVGFVAFAASIVRIATLREMQGIDVTYFLVSPLNWTVIECSLGIICVSVPPMRPLFKRVAPGFLASYIGTRTAKTGPSKLYDEGSRMRSQPRTQQEIVEDMNREMDRQLHEFERTNRKGKESTMSFTELVSKERGSRGDASPV
ncbi:hypothetical protein B0T25DRAFT_73868 [Lasiosphaeria hispida]|uniref:Rhodopsin domain-containing protein n=1 Tax=Lasiosphaeria hispida TaxID=260671 RepID=A0AAJ0HPD5_9PEZI|nr:hypothetical protein B0T25DRAFT_73868 [Lasiosphaeria hispida]